MVCMTSRAVQHKTLPQLENGHRDGHYKDWGGVHSVVLVFAAHDGYK